MKKVWLAVILSIIIPGLGHLYAKQLKPGLILIILSFTLILCIQLVHPTFLIIYLIIWIYSIVNVSKETKEFNKNQ
ncbi:sugar ABC transporter permease [Staphylococcus delphini]|uniref:sugar ABC transporter permease n=1 Tax=Staphylococcus delphini TaxID=53344 RepID=UPI0023B35147|nr:sugar ABC transporter permease [Staphylococcus delphini]MDE9753368.1 sugar ABC transporter permease [Staphylococcus delphini]MDE9789941.1 sugar ABC transporter permease [Staphylococcus delphini]MDE9792867.1 sugar ABC transporter permease [Staphylococcus delphini]MDE9794460.1 sugar ABC transporter permease [Staphylococcus delphini]MDE9796747.1 sugar ABC transporter permease [Staphylococcus delphini]